ncbi:hypothetical protein LIER_44080 [Lithospermum erythrorhizon]|uniref:Uncharacterized protein n=1 Tax=Lithospermum erythrorhizon TaxID=34254 RepID=A0AAV3P8G9_LITER
MATGGTQRKMNSNPPPRRGQIKEQIYENILVMMVSAATITGEILGMKRNEAAPSGRGGSSGGGGGGATSSPDSAYPSDGYADHA